MPRHMPPLNFILTKNWTKDLICLLQARHVLSTIKLIKQIKRYCFKIIKSQWMFGQCSLSMLFSIIIISTSDAQSQKRTIYLQFILLYKKILLISPKKQYLRIRFVNSSYLNLCFFNLNILQLQLSKSLYSDQQAAKQHYLVCGIEDCQRNRQFNCNECHEPLCEQYRDEN